MSRYTLLTIFYLPLFFPLPLFSPLLYLHTCLDTPYLPFSIFPFFFLYLFFHRSYTYTLYSHIRGHLLQEETLLSFFLATYTSLGEEEC